MNHFQVTPIDHAVVLSGANARLMMHVQGLLPRSPDAQALCQVFLGPDQKNEVIKSLQNLKNLLHVALLPTGQWALVHHEGKPFSDDILGLFETIATNWSEYSQLCAPRPYTSFSLN